MCYDGDENHMLGHVHTDLSCKFDIELMSGERGGVCASETQQSFMN